MSRPGHGSEVPGSASPGDVLQFWFGEPPYRERAEWFKKDPAFDAEICNRFGPLADAAVDGTLPPLWDGDAQNRLAHLLLLDQFTRNVFRDSPRAFAGDERALALARQMIEDGQDQALPPLQRRFVYLPFEHTEDIGVQEEAVRHFTALGEHEALDYAHRHRDVIARFGRFPHRNRVLDRTSTPEEREYLAQPGAGF